MGTPTGKIEIYSKTVAKMNYDDCPPILKWMPPYEWYRAEIATKYPISLLSGHLINRLHLQLDNTPLQDKYAIANREAVLINSEDAKVFGIETGDLVRVFNDRGQILVGANVTDDIATGHIRVYEGGWMILMNPILNILCVAMVMLIA